MADLITDWHDYLADKNEQEIYDWYQRLADYCDNGMMKIGKLSLSAILLREYLNKNKNTSKPFQFDHNFIVGLNKINIKINQYLYDEVRPVFLTEKKVVYKKEGKSFWGGIAPRLKKRPPYDQKDPKDSDGNYKMMYEGQFVELVNMDRYKEIAKKNLNGESISNDEAWESDIFTSIHACGFQSNVTVSVTYLPIDVKTHQKNESNLTKIKIEFKKWKVKLIDEYDWNFALWFPVLNPDYGKSFKGAIASGSKVIIINHKTGAGRLEKAGMSSPFKLESTEWDVIDNNVIKESIKDIEKMPG